MNSYHNPTMSLRDMCNRGVYYKLKTRIRNSLLEDIPERVSTIIRKKEMLLNKRDIIAYHYCDPR